MLPSWKWQMWEPSFRWRTALHVSMDWKNAMQGELLEFPGEVYGMVLNLEEDNVGAVLLGSQHNINEGDTVKTTGRVVEVPVGNALLRTCCECARTAD